MLCFWAHPIPPGLLLNILCRLTRVKLETGNLTARGGIVHNNLNIVVPDHPSRNPGLQTAFFSLFEPWRRLSNKLQAEAQGTSRSPKGTTVETSTTASKRHERTEPNSQGTKKHDPKTSFWTWIVLKPPKHNLKSTKTKTKETLNENIQKKNNTTNTSTKPSNQSSPSHVNNKTPTPSRCWDIATNDRCDWPPNIVFQLGQLE